MSAQELPTGKEVLLALLGVHNEARWAREAGEALLTSPRLPPEMAAREKISNWHCALDHNGRVRPGPPSLTPEELTALGDEAVRDCNAYHEHLMAEEPSVGEIPPVTLKDFTCWMCSSASRCTYVYDPYNTDGDCLASK